MRSLFRIMLLGAAVLSLSNQAQSQVANNYDPGRVTSPVVVSSESRKSSAEEDLVLLQRDIETLRNQVAVAEGAVQQDEQVKKQIEIQRKQIETLEKMIRLLAEQLKQQPPAGAAVDKLQKQVATLEARSQQAARRDQELANAVDDSVERADASQRKGLELPYTLKGMFQDFEPDISPLVVTGDIGLRFDKVGQNASNFSLQNFAPIFLYQLRDNWLLSVEPEIFTDHIEMEYARLDWIVNDWLTLGFGRMLLPFGQFNERLRQKWISKLPTTPLVFLQVLPETLSQDGVQARGATYLSNWPVKLEYAGWVTNGLSLNARTPTPTDFANIRAMRDTFNDVSSSKSVGGRTGLVLPERGIYSGTSYWFNADYDNRRHDMQFWGVDFLWHWQSWDFRFEGVLGSQEVPLVQSINRRGFYVQAAYRDYNAPNYVAKNLEYVFRYSWAGFTGIPLATLDLTRFADPRNAPVDRNQFTTGVNYYFSPSLLWQFCYEVNSEEHQLELRDDTFSTRLVWSF